MQHNLSCEQVIALLPFFVEEKLTDKLAKYVNEHLENCPECMEKYLQMKNMLNKLIDTHNIEIENPYVTKQYENFKTNLSAYIDNELDDLENIKIKKIAISNPLARQDLENIYTFKKLLHSSFEKTKNDMKTDYSKVIISNLRQDNKEIDPFFKLSALFFAILSIIIGGIIGFLYF